MNAPIPATALESLEAQRARIASLPAKTWQQVECIAEVETAEGTRYIAATTNGRHFAAVFAAAPHKLPWIKRVVGSHPVVAPTPEQIEAKRIASLRAERRILIGATVADTGIGNRDWERGDSSKCFERRNAEFARARAAEAKLAEFDAAHPEIAALDEAEVKADRERNIQWALNA